VLLSTGLVGMFSVLGRFDVRCGSFRWGYCRVPMGRVVFEVGGGGIREEIAKEGTLSSPSPPPQIPLTSFRLPALRLASAKLPVQTEFISINSLPRLGSTLVSKPVPVEESNDELALDAIPEGPADTALLGATTP
jgi:hypothetical protein